MSILNDVRNSMSAFIDCKRLMCGRKQGPHDLAPQVDVLLNGVRYIGLVGDRDGIVPTVRDLEHLHGGRADSVIFCADAYVQTVPDGEDVDIDTSRGQVTKAFEAGDMSVEEALDVLGIDRAGNVGKLVVKYVYDDRGRPKFRQAVDLSSADVQGAVIDRLREAVGR